MSDEFDAIASNQCSVLLSQFSTLRKESLLSQRELSEVMGLKSHGNITLIEQGKSVPRLDRFLKLLAVFGFTLKIVPLDEKSGASE